MIPKRVALENFLSFGPRVEIEFTDDEPLWVLGGPNGVGKSAVFDAMTFCLFGAHRGDGREVDPLVRHGADGFRVEFEFEFCGADYRVTRTRTGSRSNQAVEQKKPGAAKWERVPNVNSVPQVKEWAERTLGLGFDAFTASVLLRQGHADEIITATGSRRLQLLKKIIGAERYEELSKRVHKATLEKKARSEHLAAQLGQVPDVTAEERAAAATALEESEAARNAAREAESTAAARVEQAKQYGTLTAKLAELDARLRAAADRREHAADIRDRHARLVELEAAVPVVRELVPLRDSRAATEATVARLRETHRELAGKEQAAAEAAAAERATAEKLRTTVAETATTVRELEQSLKDDRAALLTAEEVARVDRALAELPADLDNQFAAAEAAFKVAETDAGGANTASAAANALLGQRRRELAEFGSVEVGAKCSRCHQPVSAEHAERERAELTALVEQLRTDATKADLARTESGDRLRAAKDELATLTAAAAARGTLTTKRLTLLRHGTVPEAAALHERIARAESDLKRHHERLAADRAAETTAAAAAAGHDRVRQSAEAERAAAAETLKAAEAQQLRAETRLSVLVGTLPGNWAAVWESLSAGGVGMLADELKALAASDVRTQFQQLRDDAALRDDLERQRNEALAAVAAIPAAARVAVADATAALSTARNDAATRTAEWDAARKVFDDQTHRIERRAALREQARGAETEARVHGRLDELLGGKMLQLVLVQQAQREIVRLANDTVRQLSNGDLEIELDKEACEDQAFALRVRRADSPTPIGVDYLSGSQKFRVAVSVALAIGRFAAGQARPLESVIIDEGFGSLDKEGLQAAAAELNRLKQYLRRIVLVSHQEEFTQHFPVVIRLAKGEQGTTARAYRR